MSVQALPRPVITTPIEAARAGIRDAAQVPPGVLAEDDLAPAIAELTALAAQAESLRLSLLAEAERRDLAARAAATGTAAWAAALTGETREVLAGGLRLARLLETTYAATREAFAAGQLRTAQVRVILHAAEQAPPAATEVQIAAAEELLVAKATGAGNRGGRPMDARRLRQAARRMFEHIDRDLADTHEAILLGREARTAEDETHLGLHDNGNGTFTGRFTIPELHGHLLRTALDRLTTPRRLGRDHSGARVRDESAPGTENGTNLYQSHGAAFCELLEHLPTRGHTANGTTLLITMSLESLRAGLGAARLDTGTRIDAGDARRLACNAGLVPAVLGGDSVPLDLGRTRRLHDTHQRRALALTHDTCAIDTCQRPFAWTEIHHPSPWSHGGPTDLANALPLCGHHHRRAHDERYLLRPHPGGGWRLHPRR